MYADGCDIITYICEYNRYTDTIVWKSVLSIKLCNGLDNDIGQSLNSLMEVLANMEFCIYKRWDHVSGMSKHPCPFEGQVRCACIIFAISLLHLN